MGPIRSLECRPGTMGLVLSWQYSETFLSFVQLFFCVRVWGGLQCTASLSLPWVQWNSEVGGFSIVWEAQRCRLGLGNFPVLALSACWFVKINIQQRGARLTPVGPQLHD